MTFEPYSNKTIIASHTLRIEDALLYALENSQYKRLKTLAGDPPIFCYVAKHADYVLLGNKSEYRNLYVYTDNKSFLNLIEKYQPDRGIYYTLYCFACVFLLGWTDVCPIFEISTLEFTSQNQAELKIRELIFNAAKLTIEQKAQLSALHNFTFTNDDMRRIEQRLRDQTNAFRQSMKLKQK
jgi:hypothetical protein